MKDGYVWQSLWFLLKGEANSSNYIYVTFRSDRKLHHQNMHTVWGLIWRKWHVPWACPSPGARPFLMITRGQHTYHGLDSNQPIAAIIWKGVCLMDKKIDRYYMCILLFYHPLFPFCKRRKHFVRINNFATFPNEGGLVGTVWGTIGYAMWGRLSMFLNTFIMSYYFKSILYLCCDNNMCK